jgi:hypothetical protein
MVKYIEGSDEARVQKCGAAIQQVLDRFDCVLVPQLQIAGGKMQHSIGLVAKSREVLEGKKIETPTGVKLG